jgi:hypothetical protein
MANNEHTDIDMSSVEEFLLPAAGHEYIGHQGPVCATEY